MRRPTSSTTNPVCLKSTRTYATLCLVTDPGPVELFMLALKCMLESTLPLRHATNASHRGEERKVEGNDPRKGRRIHGKS